MLFRRSSALLFLLFAAAALAGCKKSRPGHPQATCLIHDKVSHRDNYTIRGRNWNITEADFKNAINTDGTVLSRWEWMSDIDYYGAQVFKAKVSSMCFSRIHLSTSVMGHRKLTRLLVQGADPPGKSDKEEIGGACEAVPVQGRVLVSERVGRYWQLEA
jgi:hypothetical protein